MKYFKWLFITSVIIIAFSSVSLAQIEVNPEDEEYEFREVPLSENARIEFNHTVFDFGGLNKGAKVAHSYWFRNNGTDTLIITKIKPTCGCTSTKKGGIKAGPGEMKTIDIIFNSGKFNGRVSKSIKIETNDKLNPYMDIRFKSNINNPKLMFDFIPFEADFKNMAKGEKDEFEITLTNNDSTESQLEIVDKPADSFVKVKFDKETLKPNESTTVTFKLIADIAPGEYLTSVTLEDPNKKHSRFSIPISVNITDGKSAN